ncbi:phage terminase small subunit P27 family [Brevibacillus nitrificans]|uniref:phage terminase small subunit P27 family n=1 Tax=Brevibacillus nitrificans TaxID=651560 RepID=UPI002E1A161A|nr:phage terminase small subunit P27 family [Brevibacillus nitrificans]
MGARGPRPEPTNLKVLKGNPGKRPLNESEPKPKAPNGLPDPPPYLDSVAKKEWKRLAPELIRLGLLTIADLTAFETYCLAYGRLVAATKTLKKSKSMFYEYTNKSGATNFVPRPEIAVIQKESLVIKAFCAEFGLSPAARTRMEAPTILPASGASQMPDGNINSFEGFLNGQRKRNLSSS